ncbi:MAG: serine hydrolase domain-containing protein [Nitriliruptor sp.]|uniref:serine hydrolase domain-containing protein n=1 Tax=Nitriliruptor sp. TaxID=2448056 RepID=UPI0034A00365
MPSSSDDASDLGEVLGEVEGWLPDTVAVGVTDVDGTLSEHGDTGEVLGLASVTKPLAAYAVLIAVRDGLVHLDEPAGPKADQGATVRHLLAHASGLPMDEGGVMTTVPGKRRIYSNWGYEILGELVGERVGVSFGDHLAHEVLEPLGMASTVLDGSPAKDGRGTVSDLLRFARELLAPTLLDGELHEAATTIAFPDLDGVVPGYGRQSPCDWGLGFELKGAKSPHWTGDALDASTFGHFGRSGSFLWVDPTRGLAAAELADRDFDRWAKEAWPGFNDRVVAAATS